MTLGGSSLLAGCGGGSKSGNGSNGGGNGGGQSVSPDTRAASVDAAVAFVNGVATESRDTRLSRTLDFLRSRPEFRVAGINEDGVWAVYTDGVPFMVLDNRDPDAENRSVTLPDLSALPTRATHLPGARQARLVNAMGNAYQNEVPIIRPFLEGNGYNVTVDPGSVDSLRAIAGDGVFYMSAHGGTCQVLQLDGSGNPILDNGTPRTEDRFGIWTSTPVTNVLAQQYATDLIARRLGIGVEVDSIVNGQQVRAGHFFITDHWIEDNIGPFAQDSLVWFSACKSNSAGSQRFVQACLAKNAGLYVGWNSWVFSNACIVAGRFVFDRLTGLNIANPSESPKQRPFDYEPVWEDLKKRGLDKHPNGRGGTTELKFTASGAKFGILNPSISYVLVDESEDKAVLKGIFGSKTAANRKVLIAGQEVGIDDWQENQIKVTIPRTGTGSAGDVQVIVGDRKSNIRRITAWDLTMRYRWQDTERPVLKVEGPINLRLRADIGTYREKPGEAPKEVLRTAFATRDSKMELTASGTQQDGDDTYIWSGAETFVAGFSNVGATTIISTFFLVDTLFGKAQLGLALGAPGGPFTQTVHQKNGPTITTPFATAFGLLDEIVEFPYPAELPGAPNVPLPALNLTIDGQFNIAAGSRNGSDFPEMHLEWDAAPAQFPPDLQAARSVRAPR
jgi:hypothetical protein